MKSKTTAPVPKKSLFPPSFRLSSFRKSFCLCRAFDTSFSEISVVCSHVRASREKAEVSGREAVWGCTWHSGFVCARHSPGFGKSPRKYFPKQSIALKGRLEVRPSGGKRCRAMATIGQGSVHRLTRDRDSNTNTRHARTQEAVSCPDASCPPSTRPGHPVRHPSNIWVAEQFDGNQGAD